MRKPNLKRSSSPNPTAFQIGKGQLKSPEALKRSPSTTANKRFDEGTIIWGEHDSFPLEVLKAVDESPTATACLETQADFIKGSGFANPELENIVVNKTGQTLWELHCELCDIFSKLDGFSALHKYDSDGGITNAYYIEFDSLRFVKPNEDTDDEMTTVKHNPFWGTVEFQKKFTKEYPLFNLEELQSQFSSKFSGHKKFPGQVYYFGTKSPLYRFYPRPKYWSAEKWIKADGKLQTFHDENLENGFFQSTLINVIGNPSDWSTNPKYQTEETGTDGVKRTRSTKTVGEEFNEMMSEQFSGARKAGTAMVMWAQNQDSSAKIQNFPTNTNADLLQGTFTDIIRGITIGTQVPGILANLPQDGLFSATGEAFQKAVEIMESRTNWKRKQLENYYNNILLPNLVTDKPIKEKVEIKSYKPASIAVEINDKVWDFLNEAEKKDFIEKNFDVELIRPELPVDLSTGQPMTPEEVKVNETLKNLTGRQLQGIQRVVKKYNKSELTYDQAKQLLIQGYGFTDDDVDAWLITPDEDVTTA